MAGQMGSGLSKDAVLGIIQDEDSCQDSDFSGDDDKVPAVNDADQNIDFQKYPLDNNLVGGLNANKMNETMKLDPKKMQSAAKDRDASIGAVGSGAGERQKNQEESKVSSKNGE